MFSNTQSSDKPLSYGDNQGTLNMIRDQKINDLTKHLAVKFHHVRNLVYEQQCFDLQYVPSSDNLADICTKGMARQIYEGLSDSCGVV